MPLPLLLVASSLLATSSNALVTSCDALLTSFQVCNHVYNLVWLNVHHLAFQCHENHW